MKKLKIWVEESFIHKTIFFIASLLITALVLFLVFKGVRLIDKTTRINSGVVYIAESGRKYHLYEDCSNMSAPIETTENSAKAIGRERCSNCYSGIMKYYGGKKQSKNDIEIFMWQIC